jgi:hypothetical protein
MKQGKIPTSIASSQQQLIHPLVLVITGLSGAVVAASIAPFNHIPNIKMTNEVINTFFHQPALPLPSEERMIRAKASSGTRS